LQALDLRLQDRPQDIHALYFRALIWSAKQEWRKALTDYQAAARLNPRDPSLHYNCGIAAWKSGDLEVAEAQFEEARRLDPQCEGAHFYLAVVFDAQERTTEALALARRALELRPTECSIGVDDFVSLIDKLEVGMARS
jgi:tetratricopeptide (TPR) repeat protein